MEARLGFLVYKGARTAADTTWGAEKTRPLHPPRTVPNCGPAGFWIAG